MNPVSRCHAKKVLSLYKHSRIPCVSRLLECTPRSKGIQLSLLGYPLEFLSESLLFEMSKAHLPKSSQFISSSHGT